MLGLSDVQNSTGSGLHYVSLFICSLGLAWLTGRLGHRGVMTLGTAFMANYPLLLSLSTGWAGFLLASAIGGVAWGLVGGSIGNYLLGRIPSTDRPTNPARYHFVLNLGILMGSLAGSAVGAWLDLTMALRLTSGLRVSAAFFIVRCH